MQNRTLLLTELINPDLKYCIIAPHPDDEIIGCYSLLDCLGKVSRIIYLNINSMVRENEAKSFCKAGGWIYNQLEIEDIIHALSPNEIPVVPSPHDRHPLHRETFYYIAHVMRRHNIPLLVYSVDMQDWFVHELSVTLSGLKLDLLNKYYPSQKSLWKSDHRYYLFEGLALI